MTETPAWDGYRAFVVTEKVAESETVASFYLKPEDGGALPAFRPGQYIGVKLDVPGEIVPVMRSYTLSDSPARLDHYRLSIKREPAPAEAADAPPGAASNFMHDHVEVGSVLQLRAPGGDFVLRAEGKGPVVLLAGGIGCTPVLSMLTAVADSGSARDVWFVQGVRNGAEHAFGEHVRALAAAHPNIHVHVRYSRPGPADVEGRDYDSVGHIDVELLRRLGIGTGPQFYMCGSTPFMQALYKGLIDWGVDAFQINYEFFGAACDLFGRDQPKPQAEDTGESHQVTFKASGVTVTWTPASGSILDLAEASGVKAASSCRSGICHTCLARVVEGGFAYTHDEIIPPAGDDELLICSARPTGDLVLDV
jgi:ferredoxin-NADP reductase